MKWAGWTTWCVFCDFWTIYFCFNFHYLVVCIKFVVIVHSHFPLSTLPIKYVENFQTNSGRMDKFNFGYSPNNIPIENGRQYKLKLVEKIKAVIRRMQWKAFYFEQGGTRNNSKNIYYSLTSDKTQSPMKLLELFEKDLFKIVEKIKFRKSIANSKINST